MNIREDTANTQTIYRQDYTPPDYRIHSINLHFHLHTEVTKVKAVLECEASYADTEVRPLRLDGQELELRALQLDGVDLDPAAYRLDKQSLTIIAPPRRFRLAIETVINPATNTSLDGLYTSGGNFCTQCEAEGFRKITYFPDRPDVMSLFTTTVEADRGHYPVLLSNGNLIARGTLENGRHYATWHDPFPKPCYLFALVAGDLAVIEDRFVTRSGREVLLQIYVQHGNEERSHHALASLKRAMRWDEDRYGREYDLDRYMIVAVDDFNMGAMENKGLNIFNSRFVLASPETATDRDYVNIEGVIAHEYFHNWSGNRVTCRDWFQLSLKEGFTVFRDQQFTADMIASAVKRIGDVRLLRNHQFAEERGPMAHPVRPDAYVEINNFYTLTVYEKGAEVVRMLHTLIGEEGFRRGTDLYFARHDGQAVTCEDFVQALEDANDIDLRHFRRWYSQSGTPWVSAYGDYDADTHRYTLELRQFTPPTADQAHKEPLHIPVRLALFDRDGKALPLSLEGEDKGGACEVVVSLTEAKQQFGFMDVPVPPVPSLLRGFSAPVQMEFELSDADLAFLAAGDSDSFNRWEAAQTLALRAIQHLLKADADRVPLQLSETLEAAFVNLLSTQHIDAALCAEALTLPDENYLAELGTHADPEAIHRVREFVRREIALRHREMLTATYKRLSTDRYRIDAEAMGRRHLRNLCLDYLAATADTDIFMQAWEQYQGADNMTDALAALTVLVHHDAPQAGAGLDDFYRRWRGEPLVLDKWFAIQATAPCERTLTQVEQLGRHADYCITNPNRVRSLWASFSMSNPVVFHHPSGKGYQLLADQVLTLNTLNPQIAARLLTPLTLWQRYRVPLQQLICNELERIAATPALSKDVYEVVAKSLAVEG